MGFYVTFNTVQVISRRVVGRAEETSTYSSLGFCTVNCRPTASNYHHSHVRPYRELNPLCHRGPLEDIIKLYSYFFPCCHENCRTFHGNRKIEGGLANFTYCGKFYAPYSTIINICPRESDLCVPLHSLFQKAAQNLPGHQDIPTSVLLTPWHSLWCLTSHQPLVTEIGRLFWVLLHLKESPLNGARLSTIKVQLEYGRFLPSLHGAITNKTGLVTLASRPFHLQSPDHNLQPPSRLSAHVIWGNLEYYKDKL